MALGAEGIHKHLLDARAGGGSPDGVGGGGGRGVVGLPSRENKDFFWFLGSSDSWFLGCLVSWFLGFLVSEFLGVLVSKLFGVWFWLVLGFLVPNVYETDLRDCCRPSFPKLLQVNFLFFKIYADNMFKIVPGVLLFFFLVSWCLQK